MELKDLQVFLAVADAAGFRRASVQLGVRQSVVSKRVRNLEDALGVSLFERSRDGARLTHAGAALKQEVDTLLQQLEAAFSRARAGGTGCHGKLSVGVVASISSGFMQRLLTAYRGEHPCIDISIVDGSPKRLLAAVQNRQSDVAFMTGDRVVPGCDTEMLFSETIFVVVPTGRAVPWPEQLSWRSIAAETFIVSRDAPGPEIHDYLVRHLSDLGETPRVEAHDVGRDTLMSMVGLGLGITLVSGAEAGVRYPGVELIPLDVDPLPFSAVWSPANDNPALRRFLSLARALSRQPPASVELLRTPDLSP